MFFRSSKVIKDFSNLKTIKQLLVTLQKNQDYECQFNEAQDNFVVENVQIEKKWNKKSAAQTNNKLTDIGHQFFLDPFII